MSLVHDMIICKPRRSDNNTYVCPIWNEKIRKPFTIELNKSIIIEKKKQNGQYFLYIKNNSICDLFYDLNVKIIDIVKENCTEWFNNNMNVELIDDYYTNTLIYDKKHGDLIKLKCVNEQDNTLESLKCNLVITLEQLRFYKQKFVLECNIDSFDTICEFTDETDMIQEDEIPLPTDEEIEMIKSEYNEKLTKRIMELKTNLESTEIMLKTLNETKNVLKYCEDLDFLCE